MSKNNVREELRILAEKHHWQKGGLSDFDLEILLTFISSLLSSKLREVECLRLAREELLELRGMLCDVYGKFDPDENKLKKYWNGPKPEWEKTLISLK